jgi:FkbM family methyltransferase
MAAWRKRHPNATLPEIVQLIGPPPGTRLATYSGTEDIVSHALHVTGRWEHVTLSNLLEVLNSAKSRGKRSVLMDVGANVGYFTIFAASLGHHVLAYEAFQSNVDLILLSVCLNPDLRRRVTVFHAALSDTRKECVLLSGPQNYGDGYLRCDGEDVPPGYEVRSKLTTARLDSMVPASVPRVDVMKLDIEGAELEALRGGAQFFRGSQAPRFLRTEFSAVPHMLGDRALPMLQLLFEMNYACRPADGATTDLIAPSQFQLFARKNQILDLWCTRPDTRPMPAETLQVL